MQDIFTNANQHNYRTIAHTMALLAEPLDVLFPGSCGDVWST